MGSTLMGSQVMGVYSCQQVVVRAYCRTGGSGPAEENTDLGGSEDVLDGDGDLGADAVSLNQADVEVSLDEI